MMKAIGHLSACTCELAVLASHGTTSDFSAIVFLGAIASGTLAAGTVLARLSSVNDEGNYASFVARLRAVQFGRAHPSH